LAGHKYSKRATVDTALGLCTETLLGLCIEILLGLCTETLLGLCTETYILEIQTVTEIQTHII